jgi:single-strand DNA-binding protein
MKLNNDLRLIGRLGADPETGQFDNGNAWLRCRMAVNDSYKGKDGQWVDRAVWVKVQMFGPLAELMATKLSKGSLLQVAGSLASNEWQDKDGNKRTELYLRAKVAKWWETRKKIGDSPSRAEAPVPKSVLDGSDDDLPF